MDMSTIIAHGKGQWDRVNKNKRVDPDILEELEMQQVKTMPKSQVTDETILLKTLSNNLETIEDQIITKLNN
jgi:hypothetical protein